MIFDEKRKRWTAGLLVGAIALSMAAVPAAEAGNGHGKKNRRYKGGEYSRTVVHHQYPVRRTVHRGSGAGPAIAGFIGGLAVGAILSQSSRPAYAAQPPAPDDYYYYDPYCEERYSNLEIYATHVRQCSHPRVVRVFEIESDSCVDTYRYEGGRWAEYAGYDDSYSGGRDRGRGYGRGRGQGSSHRHDDGCDDRGRDRGGWDRGDD